jgi:hypothetical protein
MNGALGAGRRELHSAPAISAGEVGVESPTQATVEALGALDVGHGKHDDLELHVHRCGSREFEL